MVTFVEGYTMVAGYSPVLREAYVNYRAVVMLGIIGRVTEARQRDALPYVSAGGNCVQHVA